ncbi:hypothetical protein m02_10560, partial [Bartonella bovis m02]
MMGGSTITVKENGTGLSVSGKASATMMGGRIMGSGTGVVMGSGKVVMTSVDVSGFEKGVSVGGGKLVMNMGSITIKEGAGNYGVKVGGTATAHLTDVMIRGVGKGYGVIMEGGTVKMDGVKISDVAMGVHAKSGTVMMKGGWIKGEGGKGTGVYATGTGTVLMSGVWIEGVGKGVEVSGSGMLEMMGDSTIIFTGGDRGYGVGLEVGSGVASTILTDVKIMGSGKGKGMYGVKMMGEGKVEMNMVEILQVGVGVEVSGSGRLVMNMGKIEFTSGDRGYGVKVGSEGNALFYGVSITGSGREGTGVVMDGKMLMMSDVRISGVGMGVDATKGNLVMHKGSVEFKGKYGVSLTRGIATLKGVKMTYTGGSSTADFMTVRGGKVMAESIQIYGNGYGQGMKVNGGRVVLIKP